MNASAPELAGMLISCGAAALSLVAADERTRYAAAAVALVAAPVLVAGDVWHSARLVELRHSPGQLALALGLGLGALAAAVAVFRRWPWAFAIALFLALPLRIPVQLGGQTSHLLVPLYLVIAGGLVTFAGAALSRRREPRRDREGVALGDWGAARWLYWLLAATLILYAIQSSYSEDVSNAIENASFFLVPFAVMFVLLREVRWTPRLVGGVLVASVALAVAFAAVGFWEYGARDLLLSRGDLLQSNQLHLYFRVNSLFFDPNVFGRYLALDLVALGAYLAWARSARLAATAAAAAAVLLAALALTYSITSFVALVVGLLVVAALRWGLGRGAAAAVAVGLCAAAFLLLSGTGRSDLGSSKELNAASSGRVNLVRGGVDLARDRPIAGWGSGSFGASFARHIQRAPTTVSHSEPITVAAEQGAIGLVVYAALLAVGLAVVFSAAGASVATAAVAACFATMIVHSLGYADFAVDPATWALLGLGIGLRRSRPAAEPAPPPAAIRDPRDPRPATA